MAGNYRSRDSGITASVSKAVKGRDRITRNENARQKNRKEALQDSKKRANYNAKKKIEVAGVRHNQKITELREKGRQTRTTVTHRAKHRVNKPEVKGAKGVTGVKGLKGVTGEKKASQKKTTTRKKVGKDNKW